jgi:hypothetical protein
VEIRAFSWDDAAPFNEIVGRLRQLPEVTAAASKLGLREAPFWGGSSATCIRGDCSGKPRREAPVKTEQNVPLLVVLNRIAKARNGSVWGYMEYQCEEGAIFSLTVVAE